MIETIEATFPLNVERALGTPRGSDRFLKVYRSISPEQTHCLMWTADPVSSIGVMTPFLFLTTAKSFIWDVQIHRRSDSVWRAARFYIGQLTG
jgi:hypothetical protein